MRWLILALLLLPSQAGAIMVTTVTQQGMADIRYHVVPKAEADWLVYRTTKPHEARRGLAFWMVEDEITCMTTRIMAVPKAQADVLVHFVDQPSLARCNRKCSYND